MRKLSQSTRNLIFACLLFGTAGAVWTGCSSTGGGDKPATSSPQGSPQQQAKQQNANIDWSAVDQAMRRKGTMMPGDVYRFSMPRSDLKVTVRDVQLKPALALGSWAAFKQAGEMTMLMGDLVLTEDEVTPVMTKLQEGGIEQTALHNHVLNESPRIMYMHIGAMGDPVKMAQAVSAALALSKTPPANSNQPPAGAKNDAESGGSTASAGGNQAPGQSQDIGIDTKQIDQIMGATGKVNGGVYQFGIPRAEEITEGATTLDTKGPVIPPSMGVAQAINFQPTGGGKAAITGDFVLIASEVNPVIRALRENGIEVTALHNHMLVETPRLFFMHFWANDDAQKLARGLRVALDKINLAKGQSK